MCMGLLNLLNLFGIEILSRFPDIGEGVDTCVKTKIALLYKKQSVIHEKRASALY